MICRGIWLKSFKIVLEHNFMGSWSYVLEHYFTSLWATDIGEQLWTISSTIAYSLALCFENVEILLLSTKQGAKFPKHTDYRPKLFVGQAQENCYHLKLVPGNA